jgi:hypothetical protein
LGERPRLTVTLGGKCLVMFVIAISDGDHANYQGKETMNLVNSRHFSVRVFGDFHANLVHISCESSFMGFCVCETHRVKVKEFHFHFFDR